VPELQQFLLLSEHAKSLCTAHQCPWCGTRKQVTAERVIEGNVAVTLCHCRACGHSWHPQVEDEISL
jgi:transcription elongation factor Elf1